MDADVVIAGGGVIGTAIAWRAALSGRAVTVVDPGTDDKASLVAAGMLGPVSESVFGEQDLLNLNLLAIGRFPGFNHELESETGQTTGLRTEGTLAVAYDSDDLAALDRLTAFRHSIGLNAERLDARQCRKLEPFLAPGTRGGVLATGDLSVDNRRYLAALQTAARKAVRPVKGQILRLRHPENLPPVAAHTIRAIVKGRDIYIVPREDGELVVGATQEERDDRDVTAGAVHDLLRDAMTALPVISELILAETNAGLRPGSQDNGPIVGPVSPRLIVATGHYRNGILLSAATADAVAALLNGGQPHPAWAPFQPGRLG